MRSYTEFNSHESPFHSEPLICVLFHTGQFVLPGVKSTDDAVFFKSVLCYCLGFSSKLVTPVSKFNMQAMPAMS